MPDYALSLKQPWATLLAYGVKSIEVRRWRTTRRGRILIHAARGSDDRSAAWQHVPPELLPATAQRGGIVGAATLTGCVAYRTLDHFSEDRPLHLNDPLWFEPPVLYGFTFTGPQVLPFQRVPGWMRFFQVTLTDPQPLEAGPLFDGRS